MQSELTFELTDTAITTPLAHTPAGWLTMGLHEDLDEAALITLNAMLDFLERGRDLSRRDALAYASLHVDLRVARTRQPRPRASTHA